MTDRKRMCLFVDETMQTPEGFIPAVVYEGESGFYPLTGKGEHAQPWYFGNDIATAKQYVDEYNARLGLTPEQARDIVTSSMAGG